MCMRAAGRCRWWFRKYCQSFDGQETRIMLHIRDCIKPVSVILLMVAWCDDYRQYFAHFSARCLQAALSFVLQILSISLVFPHLSSSFSDDQYHKFAENRLIYSLTYAELQNAYALPLLLAGYGI